MSKLIFKYGTMAAGKSSELLIYAYNLEKQGKSILCFKPSQDTRNLNIESRLGIEREAIGVSENFNIYDHINLLNENGLSLDVIFVDEVQFLSENHIKQLKNIVDDFGIEVRCYGLKNSFVENKIFESVVSLLYEADEIAELESCCEFCSKKATHHLRIFNGNIVRHGNTINVGDTEKCEDYYISCCREHYYKYEI